MSWVYHDYSRETAKGDNNNNDMLCQVSLCMFPVERSSLFEPVLSEPVLYTVPIKHDLRVREPGSEMFLHSVHMDSVSHQICANTLDCFTNKHAFSAIRPKSSPKLRSRMQNSWLAQFPNMTWYMLSVTLHCAV